MVMAWNGLVRKFFILRIINCNPRGTSWSFPPCKSTWKTITQKQHVRDHVSLFSPRINIRQGTKRRSILHLEGKRAPLIIIRSPRKVVPCPWSSWCGWLIERGHYSFRASQPIIFLIRLMILFEESDSLASILNASCSLTNWLTVPLNEEGSEASVTLSRRECLIQ